MEIQFTKMHGAGNDFILADDRDMQFPLEDAEWLQAIANRKTGVGCEGIILVQPSEKADFRMRFFNPDGGEVEMCGNGARCLARFAHDQGMAPESMTIDTVAGILTAEILGAQVRLTMTEPKDWAMEQSLELLEESYSYSSVNSGVPHVVIEVEELESLDVQSMGAAVRYHTQFEPAGTNANFIQVTGPKSLSIRTYERGVEEETLACGTGMVAAALIAGKLGKVSAPVEVTCAHGDILTIDYELTDSSADRVTLTGAAEYVFTGVLKK